MGDGDCREAAHTNVPVYAVIDPANGPGPAPDAGYAAGIGKLQLAGVTVLGYVPTGYGARSVAAIEADIDRWKSVLPGRSRASSSTRCRTASATS